MYNNSVAHLHVSLLKITNVKLFEEYGTLASRR